MPPTLQARTYNTLKTRAAHIRDLASYIIREINLAEKEADKLIRLRGLGTDVETTLVDKHDYIKSLSDELTEYLENMPWDFNREFRSGVAELDQTEQKYDGVIQVTVDVDNGAGGSTLTAAGTASVNNGYFDQFDVNDVVQISNALDSDHNGQYTVSARTSNPDVLTFNATMSGADTTVGSEDKQMSVTLIERP